jgi:hypothetical protein
MYFLSMTELIKEKNSTHATRTREKDVRTSL